MSASPQDGHYGDLRCLAPLAKLQDKFGFTVDNVVKQVKSLLETK